MSVVDAAFYLKDATIGAGNLFRDTVVRVCLSCCTVVALIWAAVLMFISFYYAYMPTVHHTQPVFLKFSSDCGSGPRDGLCSFPEANVTLSKGERILMRGQKYQVFIDLDMPYSPVNEQLGMFMIKVKFLSSSGKTVATSSRSSMLHFKSGPLKLLHTIFMSLPLILGFAEEKQQVAINVFESYVDDSYHPVTSVNIVIMAKHIEVYGAFLRIEAQFSGFRFILFNWPMSSALVCISANFIVICIIFFFAYNAFTPDPTEQNDVEIETEEGGQERLYSEARRRDLGNSERRVPRSPVRIAPSSSIQQQNGRSRTQTTHTRYRVGNLYSASSTYLHPPCCIKPRRRLRSASFPPCRWEPRDYEAASGSRMGETVRSSPGVPRRDSTSMHFGFQVGSTQDYSLPYHTGTEGTRDIESMSGVVSQHSIKPRSLMKKNDIKDKDFTVKNLTVIKKEKTTKTLAGVNNDQEVNTGSHVSNEEFSLYTIIDPKSGRKFYSYSDFQVKKAISAKERENQPIRDKQSNAIVPLYGNEKLNSTNGKLKNEEHPKLLEDEKKSVLKRRSSNKTRAKFGLSFRKMLPRR